jgi:hypothetical protein
MLLKHLLFREYPECYAKLDDSPESLNVQVLAMLRQASQRIAALTADWVRVGYCQGNFNSDNCLVGGRTMDYGPFGLPAHDGASICLLLFCCYTQVLLSALNHFGTCGLVAANILGFLTSPPLAQKTSRLLQMHAV